MKPVVFKTQNENMYIYDNSTRFVLPINDIGINRSDLDENWTLINDYKLKLIKEKYSKYPLFQNIYINKEVDNWAKNSKDFVLKNGIRQLILIITEACNFRCNYCFYSDEYNYSRNHSKNMMSWNVAKKIIDYYFDFNQKVLKYNPNFKPTIGFYGGEPLLNWELIHKSVEYINSNYSDKFKEIYYTVTTNGYLLDEKKAKYLLENGFSIAISLDGNEHDHNRNRLLESKKETFHVVMDNIKKLDILYTNLANNDRIYPYTLLMTYDNDTSFFRTIDFALELPDIFNKFRKINKVKSMKTNYYKNQRDDKIAFQDILKIIDLYINGHSKGTFIEKILFNQLTLFQANNVNLINNVTGGTCIPGEKLAVTHSGDIYICERIDYQSSIGDIDNGINWDLQNKYLKDFIDLKKHHCKDCNISNLCNLCFANCSCGDDKFFINEEHCKKYKSNISRLFGIYYTALENGQIIE